MILLRVILGRDCCRFLVQPFFGATVSPRFFALLLFPLLLPPRHRAEQYKDLVFSLSPSLIILDSNIISKVIAAFCCSWMKNSTYMGPQIKLLRVDEKCCLWPLSLNVICWILLQMSNLISLNLNLSILAEILCVLFTWRHHSPATED